MESQLQIWDIFRDFSNDNVSLLRSARLAHVHGNIAILITHEDDVYLATRRNDLVPPNVVKVPELCGKEGKGKQMRVLLCKNSANFLALLPYHYFRVHCRN